MNVGNTEVNQVGKALPGKAIKELYSSGDRGEINRQDNIRC